MPLSKEEENYVRLSLLLTGISPHAVRILFDATFPPSSLQQTFATNYNKLCELKQKKRITNPQWSLMFPTMQGQSSTPDSTTLDVTLMITLLRNFSKLTLPKNGYGELPGTNETTPAADLARIKFFRNCLAHISVNKVETDFFKMAWDEISSAVLRLGNQQLKDDCDELRSKVLDQTNTQMMKEIQDSQAEIKNLQFEFDNFQVQVYNIENLHFKIPRNVEILFASETSFKVVWEPPAHTDNLQGYRVFWKENGPNATEQCKDVTKEENCTTVDGLTEMTNYWIWISTYSIGKQIQATTHQKSFRTTTGIPTRPPERVICIPNQSGRSVDISWEPPSSGDIMDHISGYTVYLQQHTGGREEEVKDTNVGSSVCRTVLEDLLPSTKYKIWISARSQYGYGPPSETKVIDTTVANAGGVNILCGIQNLNLGGGTMHISLGGSHPHDMQANVNLNYQMSSMNQQNQLHVPLDQANTRTSIEPPDAATTSSCENPRI